MFASSLRHLPYIDVLFPSISLICIMSTIHPSRIRHVADLSHQAIKPALHR